jgi:type I restriction enzyme S subunit
MVGWNVSREVAVVSPDKKVVLPVYLALWIAMDKSQAWLADVQKGVAYVGINIEDLKRLPVLIPTISEQHEIVRRVEALFAYSDTLEAKYRKAREQVDQLAPALLAKAFRGELVPQDPSDEPAEKLLESIRDTRSAQPAATRTRRTRTPRQAARSTSALSVSAMPAHVGLPTTQTSLAPPASSFDPTSVLATPTGSRTLTDLRKAAGLNQAAVAKSMGLNQAYISQMETGKRAITEDQRWKLAEILGVRVEDMPW